MKRQTIDEQRTAIYKALGEVEHVLFMAADEAYEVLGPDPQRGLFVALSEMSALVASMGKEVQVNLSGTDCRIYNWQRIAAVATLSIARLRMSQRPATALPPQEPSPEQQPDKGGET